MAQKTADLQRDVESVELGDDAAADFLERLEEFRESLSDKEKAILSMMVLKAAGDGTSTGGEEAKFSEPTDEEIEAFSEKLDRFHDDLPGDQHLFVDEMLAKTWFHDRAEVQGYHWIRISPWVQITNKQRYAFAQACAAAGGDQVRWVRRPGGGHRLIACFDSTHY